MSGSFKAGVVVPAVVLGIGGGLFSWIGFEIPLLVAHDHSRLFYASCCASRNEARTPGCRAKTLCRTCMHVEHMGVHIGQQIMSIDCTYLSFRDS